MSGCDLDNASPLPMHGLARPPAPGEAKIRHLLAGVTYGALPAEVEHAREIGFSAWIEEQLHPERLPENPQLTQKLDQLVTLDLPAADLREHEIADVDTAISPYLRKLAGLPLAREILPTKLAQSQLQQATLLRAIYSRRQLQETLVDFWNNHFSIDQSKGDCRWLTPLIDREIRAHAMGSFRELLRAVVYSPAMLFFLDNTGSRAVAPESAVKPNENFARELLELHTVGVDGGYTLRDIQEVARCFTGWTMRETGELFSGEFVFDPAMHDDQAKSVMGLTIPAGGGERDGDLLLDYLASHPQTAVFVATKLCRHFVADDPPATLIRRAAEVFREHAGELGPVLHVILTSDDYANRDETKFKRPLHYLASCLRLLHADTMGEAMLPYLEMLGQPLFHWPLPDGFPDREERWLSGLYVRWLFAINLLTQQIPGTKVPAPELLQATGETKPPALVEALAERLLGIQVDPAWLGELSTLAPPQEPIPLPVAQQWLALLVTSPEFQWR